MNFNRLNHRSDDSTPTPAEDLVLKQEVAKWKLRKPTKPPTKRPTYESFHADEIGMPLVAIGFIIGFIIFISTLLNDDGEWATLGILAAFGLPFALPIGYVVLGMLGEEIRRHVALKEAKATGWSRYDEALEAWCEEGKLLKKDAPRDTSWEIDYAIDPR